MDSAEICCELTFVLIEILQSGYPGQAKLLVSIAEKWKPPLVRAPGVWSALGALHHTVRQMHMDSLAGELPRTLIFSNSRLLFDRGAARVEKVTV
jgi:hypothetical protein